MSLSDCCKDSIKIKADGSAASMAVLCKWGFPFHGDSGMVTQEFAEVAEIRNIDFKDGSVRKKDDSPTIDRR
jgi:hypothetical protein